MVAIPSFSGGGGGSATTDASLLSSGTLPFPRISAHVASQAEAEAGAATDKLMTPQRVNQYVAVAIAALVALAPGTLDTLDELANALGDDANFAGTITTSLSNRLRVDAAQGLSGGEQTQGRDNLGLGTAATFATGTSGATIPLLNGVNTFGATQTISPAVNTSALVVSGFSLTGANAQSLLDLAGTWNTSGTPTGIKLNILDTASNAASLLTDLQVGGVSKFKVGKDGNLTLPTNAAKIIGVAGSSLQIGAQNGTVYFGNTDVFGGNGKFTYSEGFAVAAGLSYRFSSDSTSYGIADVILTRDAADTLALRRTTNAQALRVYKTWSNATDNEWGGLDWITTAGKLRIGSFFGGTGAARDVGFYYGNTEVFKFQNSGVVEVYFNNQVQFTSAVNCNGAGKITTIASSTTRAGLNLPSGAAPTSPVNGDIWYDGTNLMVRLAGVNKTVNVT